MFLFGQVDAPALAATITGLNKTTKVILLKISEDELQLCTPGQQVSVADSNGAALGTYPVYKTNPERLLTILKVGKDIGKFSKEMVLKFTGK